MPADTYSDVLSMAIILLGVVILFGVLWLLMRKCGLVPPMAVEPCGEEVPGGADQPQKSAGVSPDVAVGNATFDQPAVKTPSEPSPDAGHPPQTGGLSPGQRIAKVARRASVAVSRAVKKETGAILQALSSGADVMQIPSDVSLKSEGPPVSLKDGKVEPPKDAAASDKESHTVDTQPKKRESSLTKCPGQTSPKEDDVTTKKPAQSKDDDARNAKTGQAEPQSETRDGATQQGQPPPQLTGSQVGSPMGDPIGTATVGAGAKEQLQSQQEDKHNAAGAQLSGSVDADVGMSSEHRSTKGESRRRKSHKRSSSAVGSGSQSLAQSELKSDPGSRSPKRKRKPSSRSPNRTQS
ncbi:uncharacterized protein LOC144101700 [Amblyomma americanum]